MAHRHDTMRDRTRKPTAKLGTVARKAARRAKSARLFLCMAFPPELRIG